MKRTLTLLGIVAVIGAIFWLMIQNLQTEPVSRDEPPAIILRAPDGFAVQDR